MPPARARAPVEDSRADPPGSRYPPTAAGLQGHRNKKTGHTTTAGIVPGKDSASNSNGSAAVNATAGGAPANSPGIKWISESPSLLQAYRIVYKLDAPPTFHSSLNAAVLNAPGIGNYSPTMARKRDKRRMPKEHLALAVRKHFNGLAVNEIETMRDLIYAVKMQDRGFKMRFTPRTQR